MTREQGLLQVIKQDPFASLTKFQVHMHHFLAWLTILDNQACIDRSSDVGQHDLILPFHC
jgi:hypothetical protein